MTQFSNSHLDITQKLNYEKKSKKAFYNLAMFCIRIPVWFPWLTFTRHSGLKWSWHDCLPWGSGLTTVWLQQTVWSSCWSSMGFGPNPLINGLIQHTFKLNILFLEKIHSNTFWLDKTFSCSSQVTMMFKNFSFLKTKKNRVRFSIGGFPPKPAKQKKTSSPWKIVEVTHLQRSGRIRGTGVLIIKNKKK